MNILMLLTKPFATDARVRREASTLTDAGHTVHILEWARHGQDITTHLDNDCKVHRIGIKGGGTYLGTIRWWREGTEAAFRLHEQYAFEVVHSHDLDTLPIGVRLKRKTGLSLIYDAHEHFGWMISRTHGLVAATAAQALERTYIRRADRIITVNDALGAQYHRSGPTTVVRNCPCLVPASHPPSDGPLTVSYIGGLSPQRGWPWILDVFADRPQDRLTIAAPPDGLHAEVARRAEDLPNVTFLGTIPPSDVLATTTASDAVLCLFDPSDRNNRIGSPNKMYEAMMAGRPFIGSRGTWSGDHMAGLGAGIAVDYSPKGLHEALDALQDPEVRRTMGTAGRRAAKSEYNWARDAEALLGVYDGLDA